MFRKNATKVAKSSTNNSWLSSNMKIPHLTIFKAICNFIINMFHVKMLFSVSWQFKNHITFGKKNYSF